MTDIKEVEKALRKAIKSCGRRLQPLPHADAESDFGACCVLGAATGGRYPAPRRASHLGTELEMASIAYGFDGEEKSPITWDMYFDLWVSVGPPIPEFVALGRKFRQEAGFPVKNTVESTGTLPQSC